LKLHLTCTVNIIRSSLEETGPLNSLSYVLTHTGIFTQNNNKLARSQKKSAGFVLPCNKKYVEKNHPASTTGANGSISPLEKAATSGTLESLHQSKKGLHSEKQNGSCLTSSFKKAINHCGTAALILALALCFMAFVVGRHGVALLYMPQFFACLPLE